MDKIPTSILITISPLVEALCHFTHAISIESQNEIARRAPLPEENSPIECTDARHCTHDNCENLATTFGRCVYHRYQPGHRICYRCGKTLRTLRNGDHEHSHDVRPTGNL